MKKTVTMALTLTMLLAMLTGCGATNDTPADNAEEPKTAENFSDEMKIPYAVDLSPEDGADSVERQGDHENSPYFAHPDVYNMESTDTLTVLHNFKTQQQTSEWSCGVTSALMVLEWYDKLGDWNEESLAALRHSLDGTELEGYPGTTLDQAMDIFNGVGGFDMITTYDYPDGIWVDDIQGWLAEGQAYHGGLERLGRPLAGDRGLRHHGHRDHSGRRDPGGGPLRYHRSQSGWLRRLRRRALPL